MSANQLLTLNYLTVYLVWGTTALATKYAVSSLLPSSVLALRFSVAAALLGGLLFLFNRHRLHTLLPTRAETLGASAVGLALFCVALGFNVSALQYIDSGQFALIFSVLPLFVALLTWASGGRCITRYQIGGGVLGVLGAMVLAFSSLGEGQGITSLNPGYLLAGVGVIAWSSGVVLSKRVPMPSNPFISALIQLTVGAVFFLSFSAWRGGFGDMWTGLLHLPTSLSLLYLSVFGSVVAFCSYVRLLAIEPALRVSTASFVNPTVAVLAGALIGGEVLSSYVLYAMALTLGGTVISLFGEQLFSRSWLRRRERLPACVQCSSGCH